MNTFYIITNHQKDEGLEVTKKIQSYLEEHGKICYIQCEAKQGADNEGYKFTNAAEINTLLQSVL